MVKRRKRLFDFYLDSPLAVRLHKRWTALVEGPAGKIITPMIDQLRKLGVLHSVTRFVLSLGDEGVTLVQLSGHQVVDALFIGPDAEDGLATLRSHLMSDPRATITVCADVLEQMYREEVLPKVSRLDRGNVMKRRLDVAFPQDRLKAALPLAVRKGTPAGVLFASLPETEVIGHWIKFLEELPHPVVGFCLLPLESYILTQHLAPSSLGEERRVWRALVTQQATSGFRQIFESEGKLVVTRLTQRPPGDLTSEQVAQLIERELRSSISYVKRLGYAETDRLDLVVLADPDVCQVVRSRDLPVTSVTAYTPHQAGMLLGIGEVAPERSGFSDVLHAQWLAFKRRPLATLPTAKLRERLFLEFLFKAGFAAASILTVLAVFVSVTLAYDAIDTTSTADTLTSQLALQQKALDLTKEKKLGFEVPIEDLVLAEKTEKKLKDYSTDPTNLLRTLAGVLDPSSVLVQSVTFSAPSLLNNAETAPAAAPKGRAAPKVADVLFELRVTVRFLVKDGEQARDIKLRALNVRKALQEAYPVQNYEVGFVPPTIKDDEQHFESTSSVSGPGTKAPPITAEYTIRKKVT